MARVGFEPRGDMLRQPQTRAWAMSGRHMKDWILVRPETVATDARLDAWVQRGVACARYR